MKEQKLTTSMLMNYKPFTQTKSLGLNPSCEDIEEGILSIDAQHTLILTDFDDIQSLSASCEGPFYGGFYWSESVEAFERVFWNKTDIVERSEVRIPAELLEHSYKPTYSQIQEFWGNSEKYEVMESASYNFNTGDFVARKLTAGPFTYFFFSVDDPFDMVAVIEYAPHLDKKYGA